MSCLLIPIIIYNCIVMKKAFLIATNTVMVVLGVLLLLELTVRIVYSELGPIGTDEALIDEYVYGQTRGYNRNATGVSNGIVINTDERGFISYQKKFDARQASVLLIGDSIVMGNGVESDSTFAGLLSRSLDSLNVINPSLIDYASTDYRRLVHYMVSNPRVVLLDSLNIRHVIVFWSLNDIYADLPRATIPGGTLRRIRDSLHTFARLHLRLYQVVKNIVFDDSRYYFELDELYYTPKGLYFQRAVNDLKAIRNTCAEHSVSLHVVLMPYEYQIRDKTGDPLESPSSVLVKALEETDVQILNMQEYLHSQPEASKELYLYGDGVHLSKTGHRIVAEYLLERLAGEGQK